MYWPMKKLILFRIFALFPLIGISIPDVSNLLYSSSSHTPPGHIIVEITLSVCIIICSAAIWMAEINEFKPTAKTNAFVVNLNAQVLEKVQKRAKKFDSFPRHAPVGRRPAKKTMAAH
jgi:hypothetical protein